MSSLFIFDEDEKVTAVIDNSTPNGGVFFDDLHTARVDGYSTYEFSVPYDCEQADYILPNRMILVRDFDGKAHLFKIMVVDEQHTENGAIKKVQAETASQELNASIIRPTKFTNASVATVMNAILNGTRWQLGEVEYDGQYSLKLNEYPTVLAALKKLQSTSGHEIDYRYTFDGSRITGRYIDMVIQLGNETGKVVDYSKDIKSITRTGDCSNLVTALIGIGKNGAPGFPTGPVTFTDKAWTAGTNPVDKPSGQDWVGDPDALDKHGIPDGSGGKTHIVGTYVLEDETSPANLLTRTYAELQRRKEPAFTYSLDMLALENAPAQVEFSDNYEHERVSLGDTIIVRDLTFNPPLLIEVRVMELRHSYTNNDSTVGI